MALRVASAVFTTPGGLAPANCMPNERFTAWIADDSVDPHALGVDLRGGQDY